MQFLAILECWGGPKIAQIYREGLFFTSVAGSNTAAGIQLGILGSIRGGYQNLIGMAFPPTD